MQSETLKISVQLVKSKQISENCYGGYETGYRKPDIDMLAEICKALNIRADFLLGLED